MKLYILVINKKKTSKLTLWKYAVEIRVHGSGIAETIIGTELLIFVPFPSWPNTLEPHVYTSPSDVSISE